MRENEELRSLWQSLGGAAIGIGIGLGILVVGVVVSDLTLKSNAGVVASASDAPGAAATPGRTAAPTARPSTSATAAPTATPSPTPAPTATLDPLVVTAYSGQGLRLAALNIPANYTVTSPIAGKVTVVIYQFLQGEIRSGADVADQPSYPYIFIRSADREIKLRPGAIGKDVQLIVKDGDNVAAGAPLFKTVGTGPSSWHTFYDSAVLAQVLVSVTAQPSGTELDPVAIFKR